jgi:hypothetical protein
MEDQGIDAARVVVIQCEESSLIAIDYFRNQFSIVQVCLVLFY